MTLKALQDVLERIPSWPDEYQERAAELLIALEAANASAEDAWQVKDADLATIKRRLADPHEPVLTLDELDERLRPILG